MLASRAFAPRKEPAMARKYIDCRLFPSEMNCTIAISGTPPLER
jgi:hypothetical protein